LLRFAINIVDKCEFGRDTRRGKVLCMIVKYWLRLLHMDIHEIIRNCYEWQINHLQLESEAKELKHK
jgi:hypothetical protein